MRDKDKDNDGTSTIVPWWALFAVLALGPFGLLPIAFSPRMDRSIRLAAVLPIAFAVLPLLVLFVVIWFRR